MGDEVGNDRYNMSGYEKSAVRFTKLMLEDFILVLLSTIQEAGPAVLE